MSEDSSLKAKAISGILYKFTESILMKAVNFIVSIILARLLLPEDYGIIALVSVFITICDKLVVSGFSTSLIQKKDADNLDFSTVFFFSLGMGFLLYGVLFFGAPLIADFYSAYDRELLIRVIRVMGIQIIITAVNSVQQAYVSYSMQFRKTLVATIGGTVLSAVAGIWMAVHGYGVWALVSQYCVNAVTVMVILWFIVRWRPSFCFSVSRFRSLFSYGWKIFAASIIKVIYNDLRSLIIGKFYSSSELAYYNKGQSFPQLVEGTVSGPIESVLFSTISKKQSSKEDVLVILRRAIKTSTYVLMPLLVGLAAVAEPLTLLLLTEKWLPSVGYMQILCFSYIFMPVEIDNLQAIKAIGRSDLVLKLEIIKKTIGIILLVVSIPFGVKYIALSMLASSVAGALIDAIPNRKLLNYSVRQQIRDIAPAFLLSAVMFVPVYLLSFADIQIVLKIALQICVGVLVYVGCSALCKAESFGYILQLFAKAKHSANKPISKFRNM